ncbi:hypothetical protein ACFFVB_18400 [Formosa undariae]|uniref:Uncharacterized protein n=1 Tax=Formosa undariae TaxID=1325436 RepID=A0ABV5F7G8_9FLAO
MKGFKSKAFTQTLLGFAAFLGWGAEVPIKDNALAVSDEDKQKLQDALGESFDLDTVLGAINKEITEAADAEGSKQIALSAVHKELKAMLDQTSLGAEEKEKLLETDANDAAGLATQLQAVNRDLTAQITGMKQEIQKLADSAEGDVPAAIINAIPGAAKVMHSASHLFASNKGYDSFDGRNWNKLAAGHTTMATDFSDKVQVEKLNGDVDLYYRENPDKIKSLHRDMFGLPAFWPKRLNVDDKVSDGTIVSAEITQARKLPWLPKNKQKIEAEEGRIFPVQIDAEFIGYNLQKMEASWLNMMNKEGSQAYKVSFVMFLVSELDKKARVEDRVSSIKAIHVATPDDATEAGRMINRQDGLLFQIWRAIFVTKKLKPFQLGLPTTANIVDYIDALIKALPDDVREQFGLKLYLSPDWLKAYKRRYEQTHGTYNDYSGYPTNPKDYNNIDFEPLVDLTGLDCMFITFDDNIEVLENIPAEKGKYHFEMLKRIMYIFADYKLGIRLIHIGTTTKDGDPLEFKVQSIWSNDAPLFKSDFYIPVFDDETGVVNAKYSNLEVSAGWKTTITEFSNTYEGQIIRVKGNTSLAGATTVADGTKISLTGDVAFNLKSGGTLTLIANGDGTVTEVKRTATPEALPTGTIDFNGTTIDANSGKSFAYKGGAATVTAITGGVEGKIIVINGGAGGALTFANVAGNIAIGSAAVLADGDDNITFANIDGVWTETARTIAAA